MWTQEFLGMAAHVAAAPSDAQARGPRNMAGPRGPSGPPANIPVVDREKVRLASFLVCIADL